MLGATLRVLDDEQSDLADQVIDSLASSANDEEGSMAEALKDLGIIEQPHPQETVFAEIMDLAALHSLSSYVAAYLELAIRWTNPCTRPPRRRV